MDPRLRGNDGQRRTPRGLRLAMTARGPTAASPLAEAPIDYARTHDQRVAAVPPMHTKQQV